MIFALSAAGIIVIYFMLLFALACRYSNYAIADFGWGMGFIIVSAYCLLSVAGHGVSLLAWLVVALITVWGSRLSTHIYLRNKGKPEDFRYRQLREKWKRNAYLQAFVKLFLSQALIMWIVSTAIFIGVHDASPLLNIGTWLFVSMALFGLVYEAVSDYQLTQFKKLAGSQDKIMRQGLWQYSRHPNYFGEIVFWWGISLLVTVSTGNYLALISGITMNVLIMFVSGVPMLEDKYKKNPAYADYINTTNSVIPTFYFR
jgi:steroid 5-alpha reductase family enzyme